MPPTLIPLRRHSKPELRHSEGVPINPHKQKISAQPHHPRKIDDDKAITLKPPLLGERMLWRCVNSNVLDHWNITILVPENCYS